MNDDDQLVDMYLTRNALRQQTLEGVAESEEAEGLEARLPGTRMSTILSQANFEGVDIARQETLERLKSLEEPNSPSRCCWCLVVGGAWVLFCCWVLLVWSRHAGGARRADPRSCCAHTA